VVATIVNDFRLGVDRRRKRISGPPGSLWTLINAHLTRGGDIEKRKKMVAKYVVPGTTFGFRKTSTSGYVFGSDLASTVTVPSGVTYQRLVSPSPLGPSMTTLNDVTLFDGKIYAVATFSDGNTHHFYDGTLVKAWDDGVVRSYTTDLSDIASRITALINANTSEVATATAMGGVITITGKAVNVSFAVTAEALNVTSGVDDQTATVAETQAATAGLPEITTVTLAGTLEVGDRFSVTIGSNNYGAGDNPATVGTRLFTHGSKLYAMIGPTVYFCAVDDPTEWRSNVNGAGFENLSNSEEGSLSIVGASRYQGDVAFFAADTAQIWTLDPDPTNNALSRVLENSGSVSARSMVPFGNSDILYLSRSGLRSVRSRDVSGAPFVSDIGNAIDSILIDDMRTLGATDTALAQGMLEPVDGRYMLALGDKIYVLSYFPGSKITGWSWYEIDEVADFSADWTSTQGGKLYVRSGNTVYLYGGDDGDTYDVDANDNYVVTVGLPFMGGKRLFESKTLNQWDMALTNEWLVTALVDPRNENRKVTLGTVDEITYPNLDYPAQIDGEMFALELTCSEPGAASISNFTMHFAD
jgi:hypothetical protein